ncbi:MAG TPA: hypothetical protein DCZ59_01505 [Bacteroidetes bacterium]|nr:hypothetical protein [Bacteroidota bacterium]
MKTNIIICLVYVLAGSVLLRADVTVHSAESSMSLLPGSVVTIRWSDDLEADVVNIELWDGVRGTTAAIANNVMPPQRELTWTIPAGIADGRRYRFVVRDARRPERTMASIGFHVIMRPAPVTTSVHEPVQVGGELDVVPRPASEQVHLAWTQPLGRIEIVDARGARVKLVSPGEATRMCTVDVTDLGIGAYTVLSRTLQGQVLQSPLIINR